MKIIANPEITKQYLYFVKAWSLAGHLTGNCMLDKN